MTTTWFNQDDIYKGQAYQVELYSDYSQLKPLSITINSELAQVQTILSGDITVFPHKDDGTFYTGLNSYWVYDNTDENRTYSSPQAYVASLTEYVYDPTLQGGTQYGNATAVYKDSLDFRNKQLGALPL